jgi:hypothetical protein
MRAFMNRLVFIAIGLAAGCGKEIGDACSISSDCDPNGARICIDSNTNGGYCTIQGCDYDTCPSEASCVQFFTGDFSNKTCDPATENKTTDTCSLDELCAINGRCVSRSSEIRYCMKTCDTSGDCRDGYECRDLPAMMRDGGQPVLAPGLLVDSTSPKFCAPAPASSN